VVRHTEHRGPPRPPPRTLLLGVGTDPRQAALARAEGADLIDVRGGSPGALAAIRASLPASVLWTGSRGDPLDADRLAAAGTHRMTSQDATTGQDAATSRDGATGRDGQALPAAVIATAAICAWQGAPVVRSRHTRAVRRAIDMTASIAGSRPPSRTVRGLA
jgi:dihydropteroate synthase